MLIAIDLCLSVSGLLLVVVHGGEKLLAMDDDGYSDPYCIVTVNKEKVRHVMCTNNTVILSVSCQRTGKRYVMECAQIIQ